MEAKIGRGLDDILFGWSPAQLRDKLGPADKEYSTEDGEFRVCYYDLRCAFWFDENRLHWIRCRHSDLLLFGKRLHGQPTQIVLPFLQEQLGETPEADDFGEWEIHMFSSSWLELQFEYGWLAEVCLGYLFSDDDKPIWPEE